MEAGEVFRGGGQLNRSLCEMGVDCVGDCWKLIGFAAGMGAFFC